MIKVNMINGFFMQISRFLHLLQGISGLLRGSERVKMCYTVKEALSVVECLSDDEEAEIMILLPDIT